MSESVYDEHVAFYVDFVDKGLAAEDGHLDVLKSTFTELIANRLAGSRVLDLACGEGYLGRYLVGAGARDVIGIDTSAALIEEAKRRSDSPALEYRVDDARELATIPDGSVGVVVSQLALMDIEDHVRTFRSVRRVLTESGVFVFSILHPCFDGSPFRWPDEPKYLLDENDAQVALTVRRYATEGHWHSGGTGVRGRTGSYHRTISTYINDLIASGFRLERVEEPIVTQTSAGELRSEIPIALVVAAEAC